MKHSRLYSGTAIAALFIFSSSALAGDGQGKVVQIAINKDVGAAFIRLDAAPTGIATCSTNGYWHFTIPLNSDIDKRMHAQLVAAKFVGAQVSIGGTGSCNEFGTIESAKSSGLL